MSSEVDKPSSEDGDAHKSFTLWNSRRKKPYTLIWTLLPLIPDRSQISLQYFSSCP